METESDRPAHVSQKAKNNVIQVIPISMSTAFFKMTIESDPTMATLPDKICTTDFINYLIQFKRTSDINQCQYISKELAKIHEEYPSINYTDLIKVWDFGLRSMEEVKAQVPSIAKLLPDSVIQRVLSLLEAKNR